MTAHLPSNPSLEQLRSLARDLQRAARDGDADAAALFDEHHPRPPEPGTLRLSDAQLVVARAHGFPSWPRLKRHVDAVTSAAASPHTAPVDDSVSTVDRFLALACLTYGAGDDARRRAEARVLLDEDPSLATVDVWTMAAAGATTALAQALDDDPGLVDARGGPHRWVPLLYACYSRLEPLGPGRSTLEAARVLLDHGADPDAGYLWEGYSSPFTALAGAFGGGEDSVNQPPHPDEMELARLLLDHGADPNDSQALYNRMFDPSDDHLVLLFEHGLGRGDGGPWRRAMPDGAQPIPEMLAMQLQWAAQHDMAERVALLLDHGVDPDGRSGHPAFGGRAALALAERAGAARCVDLLRAAGADAVETTLDDRFVAACMAGDRPTARGLVEEDRDLVTRLDADDPPVVQAAVAGRADAARLMVELGCDVNARRRTTALHEAAARGDVGMVTTLLGLGADPDLRDTEFDTPPLGWARHSGHNEVAALLEPITSS